MSGWRRGFHQRIARQSKILRQQQDLNLRGQSPSDFKSDSLTTRTCCRLDCKVLRIRQKDHTPGGTRTRNPQIRSLMRYPLRHWGDNVRWSRAWGPHRPPLPTPWRNGSASDSRPEGWGFESLWGHFWKTLIEDWHKNFCVIWKRTRAAVRFVAAWPSG